MTVNPDHQALADYLTDILGGSAAIEAYWDKPRRSSIDIVTAIDQPDQGLTTCSTLGLSDYPIGLISDGLQVRAELMLTLRSADKDIQGMLATCSMDVINDKFPIRPGSILPKVVELYRPDLAMKDMFVVDPFTWNLEARTLPTKKVAWLAVVPISEAERNHARTNGSEALDALLEARGVEIFNLERPSSL